MAEKKAKIRTAIIIAVSVVAIVLSVITLIRVVPEVRLRLADGGTVRDGVLESVDEELHITAVPEGEIRYLINKEIVFDGPYSLGNVMLENPASCGYDLQFVIYNTQGEMIYTSPVIKPGQSLEKDKLSTVLRSGVYNCSYSALAYKNGELMGDVNGIVNVTVNQNHRFNRWFALPLEGAITGLTPKRGTELYYSITRPATRERVKNFSVIYFYYILNLLLTTFGLHKARRFYCSTTRFLTPSRTGG